MNMARLKASISYRYFAKARPEMMEMPFHSHVYYEFYYFHHGKGHYLIGDKIYALHPGDLILMNGMTLHRANIDWHHDHARTTLHFYGSHIQELLAPLQATRVLNPFRQLGNLRLQLSGEDKQEVEQLLHKMDMFYTNQSDEMSRTRFLLTFLEFLHVVYELCKRPMEETVEFQSSKERHVQAIMAYIENHYQDEMDLAILEKELHLTKSYISKIFKEVTGLTFFKYVFQRRINQAKVLFLLEKERSVTDVCFMVGFKHPAHFSRLFKEMVGCTPQQYRKAEYLAKSASIE